MGTVALAAAAQGLGLRAAGTRRLGVQLYTVRDLLPQHAAETLKAIAGLGYAEVEIVRADAARIASLARDAGLSPVSMHIEAPWVTGDWTPYREMGQAGGTSIPADAPAFDRLVADVRGMGLSYAVVAYLLPAERGTTRTAWEQFADRLNAAGAIARREGVTLGYHNHGFELVPLPDGALPIDVMAGRIDPANVRLELDVFWVAMAGHDPAALIRRLGERVHLLHLKDKSRAVAAEANERKVAHEAFAEVGSGTLDFPAILAAADAVGVKHLFVEQDYTPGDPVSSLGKSARFLRGLA